MNTPTSGPRSLRDVLIKDEFSFRRSSKRQNLSARDKRRFVRSHRELLRRRDLLPKRIAFENDLPIHDHLNRITRLLKNNKVVIVAGETGSGKTTQLPLALLKSGYGVRGMIAHTQPRRLAARSVAQRIANQLHVPLGKEVGYAVRFDEKWGSNTLVKIMTDGLLLAEISRDRLLNDYEVIILDEAHERSLNVDFLIGVIHRLLEQRSNLRVIITSATIDVDEFSRHFHNAPIVSVEGRSYPVKVHYRSEFEDVERNVYECLEEIRRREQDGVRDVLMFLATEREINEWASLIRKRFKDAFEILPLYARLPPKEQQRIFAPSKRQRILLSTNVAETSLTVPNIRYVIDTGKARISRYSFRARVQRLPIEQISQASANQRSGRCGRVSSGVCYRIFDEEAFEKSPPYTEPEIKRSNLASVLLQAMYYRLGDIKEFPFVDPPQPAAIREASQTLGELGAVEDGTLTEIGRTLAQFSVDPRLARMLLEANQRNALHEVSIIVAVLATQDPRLRPLDRQQAADLAHAEFQHTRSDFIALLNLWNAIDQKRATGSNRELREFLQERFISHNRVREWQALRRQLLEVATRLGWQVNEEPASFRAIHTSLIAGSLNLLGFHEREGNYVGVRELRFRIIPGSPLAKSKPKWVLAGEIVDTSQTFGRMNAKVEPRWIEDVSKPLLSYSFYDPTWDSERGEAMILCNGSLRGLPVVSRRRVRLGLHDREQARHLFVEHCLVNPDTELEYPFLHHNLTLKQNLVNIQERERRNDVVVPLKDQIRFYLNRLPKAVYSTKSFERWYASADASETTRLRMTEADLTLRMDQQLDTSAFPTSIELNGMQLPLSYRFATGEIDDGVSVQVSPDQLFRISMQALAWHVPGFFAQKCTELLQGLPKRKRKLLVPVAHRVEDSLPTLLSAAMFRVGDLCETLRRYFNSTYHVGIERGELEGVEVSPFLQMNIQVTNHANDVLDQDRDLFALQDRIRDLLELQITPEIKNPYEVTNLTDFPETGIPETYEIQDEHGKHTLYPVLVDREDHVDLVMQSTAADQSSFTGRGICRLILLNERQSVGFLKKEFKKEQELLLQFATVGTSSELLEALMLAAAKIGYLEGDTLPRTKTEFEERLTSKRGELVKVGIELVDVARVVVKARHEVQRGIDELDHEIFAPSREDLASQLHRLVSKDFLYSTPSLYLRRLPHYLAAMRYRIENLRGRVQRDRALIEEVARWDQRLQALQKSESMREELLELRFMLEEYRIGLFYQQMRGREKISAKRLERSFTELETKLA